MSPVCQAAPPSPEGEGADGSTASSSPGGRSVGKMVASPCWELWGPVPTW